MDIENIRVLLVEDDPDDYYLTRELLAETTGGKIELDWAKDYASGLAAIGQFGHDAYLVDYRLGQNNGIQLLQAAVSAGTKAPLILLTGAGDREVALAALDAGASDYLVKGEFDSITLERTLRYAMQQARNADELERKVRLRTAELEGANSALRNSEEKYRSLFNSIDQGYCIIEMIFDERRKPVDYRFLEVNPAFAKQTGLTDAVGRTIREFAPEHEEHWFRTLGSISTTGIPARFVDYAAGLGRWFDVDAFRLGNPGDGHVAVLFSDVTDRKSDESRLALMARLGEITRISDNADELAHSVSQAVGKCLNVRRAFFNQIDLDNDVETVRHDYRRRAKSVAGEHKISDYSSATTADMMAGKTVVNIDSQTDPRTSDLYAKVYAASGERAYVGVPLMRGGRWVASLWVSDDKPRKWTDEEVMLLENIGERTWLAVERLRNEQALIRYQEELEHRVTTRALELKTVNENLEAESAKRLLVEQESVRLLKQIVTIQEDERRRIARDLHDDLGQKLTALRLKLENARKLCTEGPVCDELEATQELAKRLDMEVGFLAWELRPPVLDDIGLSAALATFVAEWSRFSSVRAEFRAAGFESTRLTADYEINLYRIVQEALNNAHKYAKAQNVCVLLEKRDSKLTLIIEDDGIGFDLNAKPSAKKTMGLIGMRERAGHLKGNLEIETAPGRGTTIFVRIPDSAIIDGPDRKRPGLLQKSALV
ncbi:MAG: histidine kinase [Pyrinomonadaceae bacterium]